jgi:cysteine desulfurase / selenocysteine lyase
VEHDTIDVDRLRAQTPGVASVVHLDNAGAALLTQGVLDVVIGHLELEGAVGGYEAQRRVSVELDDAYQAVGELIGADATEVALVPSATVAWQAAFQAVDFNPGDRILTGVSEYASNYLAFVQVAQRRGVRVEVVPDDEYGQFDVRALSAMLDDDVRVVSMCHVPTNGGLVNPAVAVGAALRGTSVLYFLDACQSVGQLRVDVEEIGCDVLSFTGRKFVRAPRGTGALYVRRSSLERLEPAVIDMRGATLVSPASFTLRGDTRRFETWEYDVATRLGLRLALRQALTIGVDALSARIVELAATLRTRLRTVEGVTVRDKGAVLCGIVTFEVDGVDAATMAAALRAEGINVAVTDATSTLLDMTARGITSMVRASVHAYNTLDELEQLCAAVEATRGRELRVGHAADR